MAIHEDPKKGHYHSRPLGATWTPHPQNSKFSKEFKKPFKWQYKKIIFYDNRKTVINYCSHFFLLILF